jgi:hypothetical protein
MDFSELIKKVKRVPSGYFECRQNRINYMKYLGSKLNYKETTDWYKIKKSDFENNYGYRILYKYYKNNPSTCVIDLVTNPEGWKNWLFRKTPKGYWHKKNNRVAFLKWLESELKIESYIQWYEIDSYVLRRKDLSSLLAVAYKGKQRHIQFLNELYPKVEWLPWLFTGIKVSHKFWRDKNNRIRFIKWYAKSFLNNTSDWKKVSIRDITTKLHHNPFKEVSFILFLKDAYPNINWQEWELLGGVPDKFWSSKKNRILYMQWLQRVKDWQCASDWYLISHKDFIMNKGGALLSQYSNKSVIKAACELYPQLRNKEWLFKNVELNFWNCVKNQKRYIRWLADQLKVYSSNDWYRVSTNDIKILHGHAFIKKYNSSVYTMCKTLFPRKKWYPWLFKSSPQRFWKNDANKILALSYLEAKLKYKTPSDWYQLNFTTIRALKLDGLFANYFGHSIFNAAKFKYPEYDWHEWLFEQTPNNFWASRKNKLKYIKWLSKLIGIKNMTDWYLVGRQIFIDNFGSGLLQQKKYKDSHILVIKDLLDYKWSDEKFYQTGKMQKLIYKLLKEEFLINNVKYNFKHPTLKFKSSSRSMELDIWLPELNLGIEYQGEYHSFSRNNNKEARILLEKQIKRDEEKLIACRKEGIKLVEIWHHEIKGDITKLRQRLKKLMLESGYNR